MSSLVVARPRRRAAFGAAIALGALALVAGGESAARAAPPARDAEVGPTDEAAENLDPTDDAPNNAARPGRARPGGAPAGDARSASARTATGSADIAHAASAYCEHVNAVAASEGALLRAPWLFSTFGTLQGSSALDAGVSAGGDFTRDLTWRLQAGLGFSPTRYYLAGLLDDQAKAECERHRAEEELRAYGNGGRGVGRAALEAKIAVLREALPRADELVKKSLDALEASRTTVQEHEALALRVDALRERLASAELELAALAPADADGGPPAGSFERLRRWTAEKQAVASSLRRAGALSLTLRGGYDELFGVQQDVPVFGSVSLEFNPGWFWQAALDERAERAHAESVEADVLGRKQSLDALARQLEAELAIVQRRQREVKAALGDLEQRLERLEAAGSATAREYAEYIWFEQVRLRADDAFLREQGRALGRLTGSEDR
ncbi:MAG TPA: hypothetical protein VMG12_43475 [Polyangiaceae bacterium]|nr:hypothetical protein [Polyangiaceae bacterium]